MIAGICFSGEWGKRSFTWAYSCSFFKKFESDPGVVLYYLSGPFDTHKLGVTLLT